MKSEEARNLKPGQAVTHNRYGASKVKEVLTCGTSLFGVAIHVETDKGQKLLALDCGADIPDVLVDNPRSLKQRKES